jgi:nucleoporin NUP82
LSRPSPGASLFTSKTPQALPSKSENGADKKEYYEGPHRTLACRGLEVFVVVDNQIRWSDLSTLQSQWQAHSKPKSSKAGTGLQKRAIDNAQGTIDGRVPCKVGSPQSLIYNAIV